MLEFLNSIDTAVFHFFNSTIANPIFDKVFPFITHLNSWLLLYVFFIAWMLWKGGKSGRICVVTLFLGIFLSELISSSWIKDLIARPRPCHILSDLRLLVDCGPGKSLPSTHAVNMFASAVILSYYYRQYRWVFFTVAGLVAFSRVYIGVHYPFDVIAGALLGALLGLAIIKPVEKFINAIISPFTNLKLAYNVFFIPIASVIKWIMAFFNPKLREREKNCWKSLEILKITDGQQIEKKKYVIWFHSASMGEFEQAKPVIENIKQSEKGVKIICSFFSPSGYNNQKNYPFADAVVYLPFDTLRNARRFLEQVQPDFAVFVRYEIWRNYLELLKERNIPRILINATYPRNKLLNIFKSYLRSTFNLFNEIYAINKKEMQKFQKLGLNTHLIELPDTRFDRIISNIEKAKNNSSISLELFEKGEFVIVAGSTWEPDEKIIASCYQNIVKNFPKLRLILVPHEPTPTNIKRIRAIFPDNILFSSLENIQKEENSKDLKQFVKGKVIIVDSIGKLLSLYRYGSLAYIGGAFGVGVHSVTEPAGYGIPLIAGPKINNSPDALELAEKKCLKSVKNANELQKVLLELLEKLELIASLGNIARDYVYSRQGTSFEISNRILKEIQ